MATFTSADYVILSNQSSINFSEVPTTGAWFVDITFSLLAGFSNNSYLFGGFNDYGFWCNYITDDNKINIGYNDTNLASVLSQGIHHVKFGIDANKNYFWQFDEFSGTGVAPDFPKSGAMFHVNSHNGRYNNGRICVYALKLGTNEQTADVWEPCIYVNGSTTYYGLHNLRTNTAYGSTDACIYNPTIIQYANTQQALDAWMTNARIMRTAYKDFINFSYHIALPALTTVHPKWSWSYVNVRSQNINLYSVTNNLTVHISYNDRTGASQDIAVEQLKIGGHWAARLVVQYRAYYSDPAHTYYIQYLFIDTGDIVVCPDSIPSSQFTGSFIVRDSVDVAFTKPTGVPWYMTVLHDAALPNPRFTLQYEAKEYGIANPLNLNTYSLLRIATWNNVLNKYWHGYTYKLFGYLIESEGDIYTIEDGELQLIPNGAINWETFQQYAIDTTIDGSLLLDLVDPKVYYWDKWKTASELPDIKAILHAYNQHRTIVSTPIDIHMADGIQYCTVSYSGAPKIALKFDDGNWEMYNGSTWVEADEGEGMLPQVMLNISSVDWTTKFAQKAALTFRVVFDTIDDKISLIRFKFAT